MRLELPLSLYPSWWWRHLVSLADGAVAVEASLVAEQIEVAAAAQDTVSLAALVVVVVDVVATAAAVQVD